MAALQQTHETTNTVFEILAHHRRRYALQCLRQNENPMGVAELADEIAVQEYGEPIAEISSEDVRGIRLSLSHTHLPKLADTEHVHYDRDRDSVTIADRSELLEPLRASLRITDHVRN